MLTRFRAARLSWGIAVTTILLTGLSLAVLAPSHAPVQRGSAEDFWQAAFHLNPTDSLGGPDDAYYVDHEWCAYVVSHMHGSIVYSVPTSEVEASLEEVVERIHQLSLAGENSTSVLAYEGWRDDAESQQDLPSLIQHAIDADRKRWKDEVDMLSFVVGKEQLFWQRWNRRQYFWATICFEWILFTGLVLLVLCPFIKGWPFLTTALCLAVAPSLLILPIYLGYATYTFTSHGPAGGILYPYIVIFLPRYNNSVDRLLLHYSPPILESISTPIGEPMALSGTGVPSLTFALATGLVVVISAYTIWRVRRRRIGEDEA